VQSFFFVKQTNKIQQEYQLGIENPEELGNHFVSVLDIQVKKCTLVSIKL